jgi:hypothetical protein
MTLRFLIFGCTGRTGEELDCCSCVASMSVIQCAWKRGLPCAPSGVHFVPMALERGHHITAFVRSPNKVPKAWTENKNFAMIKTAYPDPQLITKTVTECRPNVCDAFWCHFEGALFDLLAET